MDKRINPQKSIMAKFVKRSIAITPEQAKYLKENFLNLSAMAPLH